MSHHVSPMIHEEITMKSMFETVGTAEYDPTTDTVTTTWAAPDPADRVIVRPVLQARPTEGPKFVRKTDDTYLVMFDDGWGEPGMICIGSVVRHDGWWCAFHTGEHGMPGHGYGGSTRREAVEEMMLG